MSANKSISPKLVWMNNSRIRLKFKGSCLKQENKAAFTPKNVVNLFIVYELDIWSQDLNTEFALNDCLLGNIKITKNADFDKYSSSGYGIGVDSRSHLSVQNLDWSENVIIVRIIMSSSARTDNKENDILMFGKGLTQRLDDTILTAEA